MKPKQLKAVELLMHSSDGTVASELKIGLGTLRQWMREAEFAESLKAREREQKASAARLARQVVISAAESLCAIVADRTKCDPKVMLEVLKAAGAFDVDSQESCASLGDVLREAERAARLQAGESCD